MTRARLSATVEPDLLAAGRRAVADGRAENLSAWVNEALARQVEHDNRMQAMGEWIARYESEHGAITDDEIAAAERSMDSRTVHVRRADRAEKTARSRRRGAA